MPVQAAISFVTSAPYTTACNATTTTNINTTGASLLVAFGKDFGGDSSNTIAMSDSSGNTWIFATSTAKQSCGQGNELEFMYYVLNPITSSTQKFNMKSTTSNSVCGLTVSAYSGTALSNALDGLTANATQGSNTIQAGAITPAVANELFVGGYMGRNNTTVASINSGFTLYATSTLATNFAVADAYLVSSTISAVNPTWTDTDANCSQEKFAILSSFKPAAGAGSNTGEGNILTSCYMMSVMGGTFY